MKTTEALIWVVALMVKRPNTTHIEFPVLERSSISLSYAAVPHTGRLGMLARRSPTAFPFTVGQESTLPS